MHIGLNKFGVFTGLEAPCRDSRESLTHGIRVSSSPSDVLIVLCEFLPDGIFQKVDNSDVSSTHLLSAAPSSSPKDAFNEPFSFFYNKVTSSKWIRGMDF